MKIGILTLPLHNNYGGLLQNYALQVALRNLGHAPLTIRIDYKDSNFFKVLFWTGYRLLLRIYGKKIRVLDVIPSKSQKEIISQHTSRFIENNIKMTKRIKQKVNQDLLVEHKFDAYIVGSDQVWRPKYSPQQSTYFLDFLEGTTSVKKITYAASFGVSEWDFNEKDTKEYGRLLKMFDAVSVREDSAVNLCRTYFNLDSAHLLDPTLLLDKEVYTRIVEKQKIKKSPGNLFSYILDKSAVKSAVVDAVATKLGLSPFSVMARRSFAEFGKRSLDDCVFPPVEEWIRGFMDARFVITDSFHGTVFAILFNKPFLSLANKSRGLSRFTSLLKLFHLEDRLVFSFDDLELNNLKEIQWESVNSILKDEKEKSFQFLKMNLTR